MRFTGFSIVLASTLALLTPLPAFADDPPRASADDDLDGDLDDDLDADLGPDTPAVAPGMTVPPPAIKAKIDASVAALAARSDAVGDELFGNLSRLENSNAEIERRLAEAKKRHANLSNQIERLNRKISGRNANDPPLVGYGTPITIDPRGVSPLADMRSRGLASFDPTSPVPSEPHGRHQLKWWQQLLLTLAEGIADGLKELGEARANALKAEADAISLKTPDEYRPYADASIRKAVAGSTLGRSALKRKDPRLNDLSFRRTTPTAKQPAPTRVTPTRSNDVFRQPSGPVKVEYLPRVRDPISGKERAVVNLRLGEPLGKR